MNIKENSILKPKSEEEITNDLYKMQPEKLLLAGAKYDNVRAIRIAEEKGVDLNHNNNTALLLAIGNNSVNAFNYLIDKTDVTNNGEQFCLWTAVEKNNAYFVEKLLEFGDVDPSHEHFEAFRMASDAGQYDITKIFLDDGRIEQDEIINAIKYLENYTQHKSKNLEEKQRTLNLLMDYINKY